MLGFANAESWRVQQIGRIGPGVVSRGKWCFFINAGHEVGPKNLLEGKKLALLFEKVF